MAQPICLTILLLPCVVLNNPKNWLLSKSVQLSSIAHAEVMRAVKPNMSERELEGILMYVHKKYGAEGEGYPPIVGVGANGCILHYEENNELC
jgi:Xaa-Pro aminopeptidase